MTLDEALNELGIDRDADAEGVRRAYLRLLKKRKPEVDREGFMRLREAYERAKPYFEHIEAFRAIEKVASETPSSDEGAPDLVRIETPAGVVWVQRNRPSPAQAEESVQQDKPPVEEDKRPPEEDQPIVENIASASALPLEETLPAEAAPGEQIVEPPAKASSVDPPEPSINELIDAGKFKKAARRMGREYREAVQQGTQGIPVSAPHQAVTLMLRLHEKNRVDEARALEKDFAEWLSSTGASVRIMAGPIAVMWMFARELSAVSDKFPPELREGIAKSVLSGELDEIRRRAGWFRSSNSGKAQDAALDLHAHAPTLASMLGETLSPPERRVSSGRSGSSGSIWPFFVLLIVFSNFGRLLFRCESSSPTSYEGQADPGAYQAYHPPSRPPSPDSYVDTKPMASAYAANATPSADTDSIKLDKATQDKLLEVANQLETSAEKTALENERWMVQRARYLRSAIEKGNCGPAQVEMRDFATDMVGVSDRLKATLLPNAKKVDQLLTAACTKKDVSKTPKDKGTKKP